MTGGKSDGVIQSSTTLFSYPEEMREGPEMPTARTKHCQVRQALVSRRDEKWTPFKCSPIKYLYSFASTNIKNSYLTCVGHHKLDPHVLRWRRRRQRRCHPVRVVVRLVLGGVDGGGGNDGAQDHLRVLRGGHGSRHGQSGCGCSFDLLGLLLMMM